MNKQITTWLLATVLAGWLFPTGSALAESDPCRKAVVVYLDVSGSMYEQRNLTELLKDPGRKVTLMEAMVTFLETLFNNRAGDILNDRDILVLRGFFSKVDSLIPRLDAFDYQQHKDVINGIDQAIDFKKDNHYSLADSKHPSNRFRSSPDKSGSQTDFVALVNDMVRIRRTVPLTGPEAVHQLMFIILTDGGHDASSLETFRLAMDAAQTSLLSDIKSNRIKILFFHLGSADGPNVVDVRTAFEKKLNAVARTIDINVISFPAIQSEIIARLSDGPIQIEYLHPPMWDKHGRAYALRTAFLNPSCKEEILERVGVTVSPLIPVGAEGTAEKGSAAIQTNLTFAAGTIPGSKTGNTIQQVVISLIGVNRLAPGNYRLEVCPYTKGVGPGEPKYVDFTEPEPPFPIVTVVVGVILAFFIIGGAIWMFIVLRGPSAD